MSPIWWWVFSMLFLLNDVMIDLDAACPVSSADARRFERLGFDFVMELGCELFAEDPQLQHNDPARARRLAWLIRLTAPEVNAALFAAPEVECDPALVEPRFCALPAAIMGQLKQREARGQLNAVSADKAVWMRMAA